MTSDSDTRGGNLGGRIHTEFEIELSDFRGGLNFSLG